MNDFLNSLPFIIFFLLLSLLAGMTLGDQALYAFLLLVFASMLVLNSGKVSELSKLFK